MITSLKHLISQDSMPKQSQLSQALPASYNKKMTDHYHFGENNSNPLISIIK
jgi:hypothetical protein